MKVGELIAGGYEAEGERRAELSVRLIWRFIFKE